MTVAAGYPVIASDYDSLYNRIVNEAGRRSMGVPSMPNLDPGHGINAYTFNMYRDALLYLNTLGGITVPAAKVAGQSIVTAWEAEMLFTAIGVLEGQQLTCRFARNTTLTAADVWMDTFGIWTGTGSDGQVDGGTAAVTFSINGGGGVTVNNMELYRYQQDTPYWYDQSPDNTGACTPGSVYYATAPGGYLASTIGFAGYRTCWTDVISVNFYESGGQEHLDVVMAYGFAAVACNLYQVYYHINMTAQCNGTIVADSGPNWPIYSPPYAIPGCSYTLPCNGDGCP